MSPVDDQLREVHVPLEVPQSVLTKICTIVPNVHLDLIRQHRRFMALTHLVTQNPHYATFYRMRAQEGRYVILDNSTVELGEPDDLGSYFDNAHRVHANMLIAPDYLAEPDRTLVCLEEFFNHCERYGYKGDVMGVPQGMNQQEWLQSVADMTKYPIRTIGISRRYMKMFGESRLFATHVARRVCNENDRRDIDFHLLGCAAYPETDVAPCLQLPYVSGVDSSLPSIFAKYDRALVTGMPRPPGMIDVIHDGYDPKLIWQNVHNWILLCAGLESQR